MSKLAYEDYPYVSSKKVDSVNNLTDEQLMFEIGAGHSSRFAERMQPVLKIALRKRQERTEELKRSEELAIAYKANEIAEKALAQSELANKKSDQTRIGAAISVLVTVLIAAIGWLRSA